MPPIPVGSPAPDFTLRDASRHPRSLTEYRGRAVVLYFYPEDDTPLCTAQACQFRDHHADFVRHHCVVIGISPDDTNAHASFTAGQRLPFTPLSDEPTSAKNPDPRVSTLYGAWGDKNMYGNIVRSMLRTTYLIGPDGLVARRWDRVKTPGHAAKVLQALIELQAGLATSSKSDGRPTSGASKAPPRALTNTDKALARSTRVRASRGSG